MAARLLSGIGGVACVVGILAWGCGGSSGYGPAAPAAPSPTAGGSSASTTVSIVGTLGAQSFTPNPASATQGATIAWVNNDGVTHRIVMDDGSGDTGNIAPGSSSQALKLNAAGARYHCSIHPSMVGSINASTGTPNPCPGLYCDSSR